MPRILIKLPVVRARTAESKSEIYRKMDRGAFPLSVTQGPNSVAWYEDEIEEYVNTRPRRAGQDFEPEDEPGAATNSLAEDPAATPERQDSGATVGIRQSSPT